MYNHKFCKLLSANYLLSQVFTKILKNVTILRIVNFNLLKTSAFRCRFAGVCVQNVNTLTPYVRGLKAIDFGKRHDQF
jgi:hypothetical protein